MGYFVVRNVEKKKNEKCISCCVIKAETENEALPLAKAHYGENSNVAVIRRFPKKKDAEKFIPSYLFEWGMFF